LQATLEEREKGQKILRNKNFDVCLTTYEGAKKNFDFLYKINFKLLIVDEAHKLKNEKS